MKLQQIINSLRRIFVHAFICLIVLSVWRVPTAAQTGEIVYDVVIRNGRVLDGAGNPWILADVAVKDGRFVRIGKIEGKGKREIDAKGRYVSPGWIDVMDQSGFALTQNGLAENKLLMGVTTAIGGEGKELVQSIEEAITIGEKGKLPVEIFHLKAAYQPGWGKLMREAGEKIEQARTRGVDVAADMYLYTAGGTGLEAVIPSWAFEGRDKKLLERLKDPAIRTRLKQEIKTGSPGWWNIVEAAGGWDSIVLVRARNEENKRFEGKSLTQIAKELNKEPADAAFDFDVV